MAITINSVSTNKFSLIKKEAKNITFTYNVDISSATFDLIVKDLNGVIKFVKADTDFDKTQIAQKIVSVNLSTDNLDLDLGNYEMQVKTTWNVATSVDKTIILILKIKKSLFA